MQTNLVVMASQAAVNCECSRGVYDCAIYLLTVPLCLLSLHHSISLLLNVSRMPRLPCCNTAVSEFGGPGI